MVELGVTVIRLQPGSPQVVEVVDKDTDVVWLEYGGQVPDDEVDRDESVNDGL